MTLVISIITDEALYIISDAMLSVEKGNVYSNSAASYPTKPDTTSIGARVVTGLTQKVTTIREGLHVGWSGDHETAWRFIGFLKTCLKNVKLDESSIRSAQVDYFNLHSGDTEAVNTLIVYEEDGGIIFFPQGKFRIETVPAFGTLYVLGSGTDAFIKYFSERAPQRFAASGRLPSDIDIIYFIMEYVIGTVRTQQVTGVGVGEGWGGWFEILLAKGSDKLRKLDRIMYASMLWEEIEGEIVTFRVGRRYFHYYDNDNLLVFSQGSSDKLELNLIPPPDHGLLPQKIAIQQTQPQVLCLELVNRKTRVRTLTITYDEAGHNLCGFAWDNQSKSIKLEFQAEKLAEIIRASCKPSKA